MKKFSILLLALAIAAFAVPAMAGDVAMDGEYTFGGEQWSNGVDFGTFYDELDLNIEVSMDDVMFHWDFEVVDDPNFDRIADEGASDNYTKVVDTMYVKWTVNDALSVKIGDYGVGWGADIVEDAAGDGTGTVGIMYGLDAVDLAFYLSRNVEGGEDDDTMLGATVEGEIGPAAVGLIYLQTANDTTAADDDIGLIGVFADFAAGPVGIYVEYGQDSAGDAIAGDGGTVMLGEFGLGDLVGFGLGLSVVQTNSDWANVYDNDFDRVKIYDAEPADAQLIFVNAEYEYSDELTLGADVLAMSDVDGDDDGTEFDVWAAYSFADNVAAEFGYASYTEGDLGGGDATVMWHEWVFEF